jgi:hypothetical protein
MSLVDAAYEQIRQRILDNVWPPGHRALEQEVALELGMSRTPVREALMRLQNEGLVEVIPRHGMRVLPVSPTDMREIYQILTALECMAPNCWRRKPGEAELAPLVDATSAMDPRSRPTTWTPGPRADERFHAAGGAGRQPPAAGHGLNYWDRAHRAACSPCACGPSRSTRPANTCIWSSGCAPAMPPKALPPSTRAHRERASRELLAIFERYKLAQM